jgi:YgiT-type zinc finger domain-containing protein
MVCAICRQGELESETATVTLERGGTTVVIRGVPARVCSVCGEEFVDESATTELLALADRAAREGVQVEIRQFAIA